MWALEEKVGTEVGQVSATFTDGFSEAPEVSEVTDVSEFVEVPEVPEVVWAEEVDKCTGRVSATVCAKEAGICKCPGGLVPPATFMFAEKFSGSRFK